MKKKTNKEQDMDLRERLMDIVTAIRFEGWKRGKEQKKTSHEYTLGNEDYPKEKFQELLELITSREKKLTHKTQLETIEWIGRSFDLPIPKDAVFNKLAELIELKT